MKPASNNLATPLFIISFLSWAKWWSHCLTGLAFRSKCNLCSINSLGTPGMSAGLHVKMSLFSYRNLMSANSKLSHLRRFLYRQWDSLVECVLWLDGHLGSLGVYHDRVRGGLSQGLLQLLELCGCEQRVSSLTALSIAVEGPLDVSPEGDDTTWPRHLQD
jgi:hypothetical protein